MTRSESISLSSPSQEGIDIHASGQIENALNATPGGQVTEDAAPAPSASLSWPAAASSLSPQPAETTFRERDDAYENCVEHQDIKGYFTSFQSAVTVLRIAYQLRELDASLAAESDSLSTFFVRLQQVERQLREQQYASRAAVLSSVNSSLFVVLVEGLDGSGKTTLVQRLVDGLREREANVAVSNAGDIVAMSTPTASMTAVRAVFDHRGGPVARAFYMVSNYVLQQEIQDQISHHPNQRILVVVDRWFASTCAYSIAWKNTTGGPESVNALDDALFTWPYDLVPPNLLLLLDVDDNTRRNRVTSRRKQQQEQQQQQHEEADDGGARNHNPWDDRLQNDPHLGQRIMRALGRSQGPREIMHLDANQDAENVYQQAIAVVHDRSQQHFDPWDYFKCRPLDFFRYTSARLGLCHAESGRRCYHAPWAMQLALNDGTDGVRAPTLRTVGIHTLDASGILFFTSKAGAGGAHTVRLGGDPQDDPSQFLASMTWVGGEYPDEQQWRAEGILFDATLTECQLLDQKPPPSLVAHLVACSSQAEPNGPNQNSTSQTTTSNHHMTVRPRWTGRVYHDALLKARQDPPTFLDQFVSASRFVPLRMEVLIGGPSSPQGPRRYEWHRRGHDEMDRRCRRGEDDHNGWTEARAILPFSPSKLGVASTTGIQPSLLPVTLVLTGSHCSGKATLGKRLARVLGWPFHEELGDQLRDGLEAGGHRSGDGSGSTNAASWDALVYDAESKRDAESVKISRVVETWHMGNSAWALLRCHAAVSPTKEWVRRAQTSIQQARQKSVVLWVHLSSTVDTMLRRRRQDLYCARRIPMKDDNENDHCRELCTFLEERDLQKDLDMYDIPHLTIDNNEDGDQAVKDAMRRVVGFVHVHQWRRGSL